MSATLAERFSERATQAPDQAPLLRTGRLDQMVGLALQARGLSLPLESACAIPPLGWRRAASPASRASGPTGWAG